MTTLHKAAQQALDWLYDNDVVHPTKVSEDLRAALAQQEEPKGGGRLPPPLQAEPVTEDMKSAVRWAPSSAYWSERLREFFGPDAREGIDALERRIAGAQERAEPDLSLCPQCNGPADNGHDRSIPPSPYLCTKCMAEMLEAALAQQAEPVAWLYEAGNDRTLHWHKPPLYGTPLYTSPPQRKPQHQTATGRKLYTVQQIRAAYAQGTRDSRGLLVRCRNMLSHPAHWGAEEGVVAARYKLYTEVLEHLNGLENCEAWTEREKRLFREQLRKGDMKMEDNAARPGGSELSDGLGAGADSHKWQPVDIMPQLERGGMGILECRNLLVWIDEPHTKGFVKGGCYKFPGETQASFRAEGYNGNWRITHWMRIESPNVRANRETTR